MTIEEYIRYRIKTLERVKEGLMLEMEDVKEGVLSGTYGKLVPRYNGRMLQEVNVRLNELKEIACRFGVKYDD